jgi:hypothetical protein
MDARRPVEIRLTYGEVVVLSDLLHRWEDDGTLQALPYLDDAERIAMWNLNAVLEPLVDDAFSADAYVLAVKAARSSLRDE